MKKNLLRCRECGKTTTDIPEHPTHVCDMDFGPLEVVLGTGKRPSREDISSRPRNIWRYREFLPASNTAPRAGLNTGFTPLIDAPRLAAALGVDKILIKDETTNQPTLSFKDRVVAVALERALQAGFSTVTCSSTGNLAHSLAAQAARLGLRCIVFVPATLEPEKLALPACYGAEVVAVDGTYDQVNRLVAEAADKYQWGVVSGNLRPFYAEGSKTVGFEIAEQLGWRLPRHTVVPMASGSLLTKIAKAYSQFVDCGLVSNGEANLHGAQAEGCSPISTAINYGGDVLPVANPRTIARSLAIGSPADGTYAANVIRGGGSADVCSDQEIIDGVSSSWRRS